MEKEAISYADARKEIDKAFERIQELQDSVKQNEQTVKLDSIITFFTRYCKKTSRDNGFGEEEDLWQIDYNDSLKYGFSSIQDMIDRIKEIDAQTFRLNDALRSLTIMWLSMTKFSLPQTIVIVFANGRNNEFVSQLNHHIMKECDDIKEHNLSRIIDNRGNRIYYVSDGYEAACGIGGVSALVFFNIHEMKFPLDTYTQWVPTLSTGGLTYYVDEEGLKDNINEYLKKHNVQ